tara:strand:- start:115 stop:228 length:114 start_codon:yes stop_codon:yes gene_type:complete
MLESLMESDSLIEKEQKEAKLNIYSNFGGYVNGVKPK